MFKGYWFAVLCLGACLYMTGCKVTPDQVTAIANAVGLFSSVTWIAIDNPPKEVKTAVIDVLGVVMDKSSSVSEGQTYLVVLYPEVVKIIDNKVAEQYRPLCKAGAATLLGQLDILFAAHPEWKTDEQIALDVTVAFCLGADQGLSLSDTDLMIVAAKQSAAKRVQIMSGK